MLDTFYEKVVLDPLIGPFFTEIVKVNWETHMPVMYSFWESILLQTHEYRGNPMIKHLALHQKKPMKQEHFDRWVKLFHENIDSIFSGERAVLAKTRAISIATMIRIKTIQADQA